MADIYTYVEGTSPAKIKVIGTGGAGCNAVNNMIDAGITGVDFIVANTDVQALERSKALNRIQLGERLCQGMGAGGDPDTGRDAAKESRDSIRQALEGANMVFIATGLGGGTGTGSAPVIAEICKDMEILTVAVVTTPFEWELGRRASLADSGLNALKEQADTVITIPNEKMLKLADANVRALDIFKQADEVLINSVKGVSELIIKPGYINRDFKDLKKVMTKSGLALMGIGAAEGDNRAEVAAKAALSHPLLEDVKAIGAHAVLINITAGSDLTMAEMYKAAKYITNETGSQAEVFFGFVIDDSLGQFLQVTVIAAGISQSKPVCLQAAPVKDDKKAAGKVVSLPQPEPENVFQNLKDIFRASGGISVAPSILPGQAGKMQKSTQAEDSFPDPYDMKNATGDNQYESPAFLRKQAVAGGGLK
ncbi:MAG: cell division protein FtsZ [Deltaproteobacteria bacterium]|nr:cell division protein FtsZ [Deltaproteobacteria bacterium]